MPDLAVTLWVSLVSGIAAVVLWAGAFVWSMRAGRDEKASHHNQSPWLLRAPLLPLVLAVVTGLIAVYALILHTAFGAADFQLPTKANVMSPILVAATLIAGTLTAAYAVLKLRAHLLTEARGRLDASEDSRADERHRNDQEVAYSERFSEAVKLLADENRSISRIAGAHLVFAIGDEWRSSGAQQRCFDVLLSHLRALNLDKSFDDEALSKALREEVRLITSDLLRRLCAGSSTWDIQNVDFSGAVLTDLDFAGVGGLSRLDLSSARVLGSVTIPANTSISTPNLAGLVCDGDLVVENDVNWQVATGATLDLSNAEVSGSVVIGGATSSRTLGIDLDASGLATGGDLLLDFDLFLGNVVLDSVVASGTIQFGTPGRDGFYGTVGMVDGETEKRPTMVSAVEATFGYLKLRRAEQGPRLDLSEAQGPVDLTGSTFPAEVSANNLDASSGLYIKDAHFESMFVLDGAVTPEKVDLHGTFFSPSAKGAFNASKFALREVFIAHDEAPQPVKTFSDEHEFRWQTALSAHREECSPEFLSDLERRMSDLEDSLPVDWHLRPTFTAKVMSAVSRAAAKTDAPRDVELALQVALRDSLQLAVEGQERP